MAVKIKIIINAMIILLAVIFISCGNNITGVESASDPKKDNIDESVSPNEPEDQVISGLPDMDFGGETLNLLVRSDATLVGEFYAEEETGDLFNDAIFKRNKSVEEFLNINLNIILGEVWQTWVSVSQASVKASILAGDKAYDLIADWGMNSPVMALEGFYMNLNLLPHLDFSKTWWNKNMIREAEIGGKLFFAAGDLTTTNLTASFVYFFNKKIQQNYAVPDFYQTVMDGKWTNDYLLSVTKNINEDINGDGLMDENDLFGINLSPYNVMDSFLHSSNIKMISRDGNGMPVLDVEHEKLSVLVDTLYTLLYENPGSFTVAIDPSEEQFNMFLNDRALFMPLPLSASYSSFRNMQSDYGILPPPKFDENQNEYYTRVWADVGSFMCVTMNCEKLEAAGAFLEAAAAENYKSVMPVLYEIALKVKFSRDEMSSKMLDIIREGIYFSFASIYNMNIEQPCWVLRNVLGDQKSRNFASWYDKNGPRIERSIEKLVEQIESME